MKRDNYIAEFTRALKLPMAAGTIADALKSLDAEAVNEIGGYVLEFAKEAGIDTNSAELAFIAESKQKEDADTGVLFSELMKIKFPYEPPFVDGLIYPGLTVLTGASKIGKSFIALQLVTALDNGGFFLGTLKAEKCDVLYCALEDTPKRVQTRILKQGAVNYNNSRLETKRRTPAGLKSFLEEHKNFRVVIIDTLQKMLGVKDMNDYSQTVDGLSALKDIADTLGIAVVVIHHNRKGALGDGDHMESALGSTGINATADTTLTMSRKRGTSEATLSVTGRDVEDTSYSLAWDRNICSWAVTDKGDLVPAITPERQKIVDLLDSDIREWETQEIADALCKSTANLINNSLNPLLADGKVQKLKHGKWASIKFTNLLSLGSCKLVNMQGDTTEPRYTEVDGVKMQVFDEPEEIIEVPDLF